MSSSLRLGYECPGVDAKTAVNYAVLAEKWGLDGFWIPDHFVDLDGWRLDPWTTHAAITTQTRKLRLGSGVTDTQRTHPARIAHVVSGVDVLSNGRTRLGIGTGEAMNIVPYGLPWESVENRVQRLRESIHVIRALWQSTKNNPTSFDGQFYKLEEAYLRQNPVQKPGPPVFIGAISSKRVLELIGEVGDGWYGWFNTPESFRKKWSIVTEAARNVGRSPDKIRSSSLLMFGLARTSEEKKLAVLNAKIGLLLERSILKDRGLFPEEFNQYQRLLTLNVKESDLIRLAESLPDDIAFEVAAIGGIEELVEKIEMLSKIGLKMVVVTELSPPSVPKKTMGTIGRAIKRTR